jgi:DNA-binding NtrC family response regulator
MAHILLVDDDEFVRAGLAAVLAGAGHMTAEASSIMAAETVLAEAGDEFDIVLLDLWLPDGSGLGLLDRLMASRPHLPVVVMSGGGPGRSLEQALAVADATGAAATIIKPFQNAELIEAVEAVLQKRSQVQDADDD